MCELAKIFKYECSKPFLDSYNLSQRNDRNLIILLSHKKLPVQLQIICSMESAIKNSISLRNGY